MILFGPFLRANPKLLRFVTNRVLTERFLPKKKKNHLKGLDKLCETIITLYNQCTLNSQSSQQWQNMILKLYTHLLSTLYRLWCRQIFLRNSFPLFICPPTRLFSTADSITYNSLASSLYRLFFVLIIISNSSKSFNSIKIKIKIVLQFINSYFVYRQRLIPIQFEEIFSNSIHGNL